MSDVPCALYLRVSLDRTGEELAVSRQRDECMKIIEDRGWVLYEEYMDNSISASSKTAKRPNYDRMVADYQAGRFGAVVCWDLDRLTRQPRQLEDWIDWAEDRGLRLVTANGEADLTTDSGRLFARIKSSVARAEVERKGARQRAAHRQRVEQGRMWGASRPLGYAEDGRTLVAQEAAAVRGAAADVIAGGSLAQVARDWADAGIRNEKYGQRPYSVAAIRKMLQNPAYAGRLVYKGEVMGEGDWEPLFDTATHLALVKILGDPARNRTRPESRRGPKASTLLSGLFDCGRCPGVTGRAGTRKGLSLGGGEVGPRRPTYFCPSCEVFVEREPFETEVETRVVARLAQPDYLAGLVSSSGLDLADVQAGFDALSKRERELGELFGRGVISGLVLEAGMVEIEAERVVLDAELGQASAVGEYADLSVGTDVVVNQYEGLSLARKRGVIRAASKVIRIWPAALRDQRVEVVLH